MATKIDIFNSFRLFITLLLFTAPTHIFSQQVVRALDTGEHLPDITLANFFEQPGKKLRTTQLMGKLVILDFWNIHCSACLVGMPEMDSLQQVFGERIKILLVTKDKSSDVKKLFDRIGMRERIKHLEVLTEDTILHQLFKHDGEPHHAWINQDGIYSYGTYFYNATGKNIQKMLDRQKLHVTQRESTNIIDDENPLVGQLQGKIYSKVDQYSLFLKGTNDYTSRGLRRFYTDSVTQTPFAFTGINLSPLQLLQSAFNHDLYSHDWAISQFRENERIIILAKDSTQLFPPEDLLAGNMDDWEKQNLICYEVRVPDKRNLFVQMQSDLNGHLPIKGNIEKRKRQCYVVSSIENDVSLKVKAGTKRSIKYEKDKIIFSNIPVSLLLNRIENLYKPGSPIFVDQTGLKENVSITISKSSIDNPLALNEDLEKFGLKIDKKVLQIPMLVIYDR